MAIRTALVACALAFGTLAAVTTAYAGDPYGGFGPSETGTQEVGSDLEKGAPTPEAYQALPWLQQQSQSQPESYDSEWDQQGVAGDEYDMDDEGGH
jgi:hypothetical protein